jgi:N-acylneuraminate cytidylyltransferase
MKKNGIAAPEDAAVLTEPAAASSELPKIRMFLTDCDGCLTDGGMYYSEFGDELKKFNTRDGMGFALLREQGIVTGIVTSESVDLNRRRAEKLKLDILEAGCKDKPAAIRRLAEERGIPLSEVCYVGDDINDAEALRMVGYGCAPADAMPAAREAAKYVTKTKGGEGVIREVADRILAAK